MVSKSRRINIDATKRRIDVETWLFSLYVFTDEYGKFTSALQSRLAHIKQRRGSNESLRLNPANLLRRNNVISTSMRIDVDKTLSSRFVFAWEALSSKWHFVEHEHCRKIFSSNLRLRYIVITIVSSA